MQKIHAVKALARWRFVAALMILAVVLAGCQLPTSGESSGVVDGPPEVRLVSPTANARYLEGVQVNIQAVIANAGADINRVEVVVDDTIIASLNAPNAAGAPTFSIPAQSWEAVGVGSHTISVIAFRGDGSSSAPAAVTIEVVAEAVRDAAESTEAPSADPTEADGDESVPQTAPSSTPAAQTVASSTPAQQIAPTTAPTSAPLPTNPPPPTNTPAPTSTQPPPPTATPNVPTAVVGSQGINVRRGPSTLFNPPLGGLQPNTRTEILALSNDRAWYKIRFGSGDGWIFAQLVTTEGDLSRLPLEAGPPLPTLTPTPLPTAIPATPTAATSYDIEIVNVVFIPDPPRVNQTFQLEVTVRNNGPNRFEGGGVINVSFTLDQDGCGVARGQTSATTQGALPSALDPGQQVTIARFPITISVCNGFAHRGAFTLAPVIADSNPNNNTFIKNIARLGD